MKSLFRLLCVVAVALLMLPMSASTSTAQDAVTISLWSRDSNQAFLRELADAWNASNKDQVEVTVIPASEFVARVGTAFAGGEVPDLLPIDLIYVPEFAKADKLTEMGEWAKKLPFFDKLSPSHIRLGMYDGGLYSVPFAAEGSVLLYNKGLFKQAGLDPEKPPTNWSEIYEAAKKINALGNGNYGYYFSGACAGCNAFTFLPLIWASGGDVLSEDGLTATVDTPEVKAALEFYAKLWKEGLVPPGAQADTGTDFFNAFAQGNIGMVGSGAFSNSLLKKDYPNIEFGITYLPGEKGGKSSFAGGDSIAIPKGAKHADIALKFIEWMLSDDVQIEMYAKSGQMPVRIDLANNKYFEADPRLTVNADAMGLGKTPYSFVYNQLFNDPNGPWLQMFQKAIFDGDVDGAIKAGQEQFVRILAGQ